MSFMRKTHSTFRATRRSESFPLPRAWSLEATAADPIMVVVQLLQFD